MSRTLEGAHAEEGEVPETPLPGDSARRRETVALKGVVTMAGAVLMALEILGSRVLAPSYGSSVYVWGSLISTFLIALAVGYATGGRIADRTPSLAVLAIILAVAAVLILPCVAWGNAFLQRLVESGWDARWSALLASVVLFLPASVAMGMVTPFGVRIAIRRMEAAGSTAGSYSALSTLGSILGTLLTTFLLIPQFPINSLLLALAATLVICALVVARSRKSLAIVALAGSTCGFAALGRTEVASNEKILLQKDTAYHHIMVTQLFDTRRLRFDGLSQSAVNIAHPEREVLQYVQGLELSFAMRPGTQRVCMIGLGGGSIPRMLARVRPDVEIDTVEIDPAVRSIARQFFLYRESERIRTVVEDGRAFLAREGLAYDLVILDAFNSTGVPFHLTTREFFGTVRHRLKPDGLFAANFVANLMGRNGRLFWATYQTIRRQFGQVYVINPDIAAGKTAIHGNVLLFATLSADPLPIEIFRRTAEQMSARWKIDSLKQLATTLVHSPDPPPGTPELTDAYAPVEALQHF